MDNVEKQPLKSFSVTILTSFLFLAPVTESVVGSKKIIVELGIHWFKRN
jgi:hypothetical protein